MTIQKINPFQHEYFLGYISQVFPQFVKIHFPSSVLLNGFTHLGQEFNGGLVGTFIVIEGDKFGFLGRITELSLPESERLALNEKAFQTRDFHPTGKIEILLSFDLYNPFVIKKGLDSHPNIGAKVYVSSSELVRVYMSRFGIREGDVSSPSSIGKLVSNSTEVNVSLQSLFGRHCAVVGTTGGGKSFTVSKLIETLTKSNNKAVLIDATGEYDGKYDGVKSIEIGTGQHCFHYSQLSVDDLFYLMRPSSKTQVPKLMEAIRSLKIVAMNAGASLTKTIKLVDGTHETVTTRIENGLIKKGGSDKRPFEEFYFRNLSKIESDSTDFEIEMLPSQITQECVWDTASRWEGVPRVKVDVHEKWGDRNDADVSYCISLISRVNNIINTAIYQNIFGFKQKCNEKDITSVIDKFIKGEDKLLRLDFGLVPFDFQVREILANAIGRFLLNRARNGDFKQAPIVLFIDEAHQFLNKTIKDEYFDIKPLEAFDSIAKECRKHGLFICIATQMPRDIPHGTLSQMGTFVVHRLINQSDKDAISNACSSANKNTLEFLPVLGEGEAILTGVDFPMPIILKFDEPQTKPNSKTPRLKGGTEVPVNVNKKS